MHWSILALFLFSIYEENLAIRACNGLLVRQNITQHAPPYSAESRQ